MKFLAPLVFALTLVAAHPQGSDGLQNRPAKRGQDLEKKDAGALHAQAWKRHGDWHQGGDDDNKKCSDFLCRIECKKQGFCRSECKDGRCKCSVRQDKWGRCNIPSKKPNPPGPKPTSSQGDDNGQGDNNDNQN